jgi:alkylation response protein AidB-like acyl-CoA dehydrogenase
MTRDELMAIVRDIEPVIRKHAAAGERDRRVPKETADAIRTAGLFKIWVPKALGGWEVDPVTGCRVFEEVASIDSAAGWMVQMCSGVSLLGCWFGEEGIAEMHEGGDSVFADSFAPPMRLEAANGGYKVTGQASFASNCHHVDWFFGLGMEFEGEQPKRDADGNPATWVFAVPRAEYEIVENWNTLGMRGTGSHDVRIDGVFVPERRVARMVPLAQANNVAYRNGFDRIGGVIWPSIVSMGAVGLGIARAGLAAFKELCGTKTANFAISKVGASPLTHYRLGEAHAHMGAGRAYLYEKVDEAWQRASRGEAMATEGRCDLAAASAFAIHSAARAFDLVADSAGTSIGRDESPMSRYHRDLHTLTQHAFATANRYEDIGRMLLRHKPLFNMFEH